MDNLSFFIFKNNIGIAKKREMSKKMTYILYLCFVFRTKRMKLGDMMSQAVRTALSNTDYETEADRFNRYLSNSLNIVYETEIERFDRYLSNSLNTYYESEADRFIRYLNLKP